MRVEVAEVGDRPVVWTRARMNAPLGAKRLGEIFAEQDWADKVIVMLDWQPEEIAEHAPEPIVRVWCYKQYAPDRLLTLEARYAVNDLFDRDQITINELGWITEDFKGKLDYELQRAGANH